MNKINKFLYFFLPMMILVGCADLDGDGIPDDLESHLEEE